MRRLISGLAVCAVMSLPVWAQAGRAFDVASVREVRRNVDGSISMNVQGYDKSGTVALTGYSLDNLISTAYGVDSRNVTGMPEWSRDTFFTVQAKSDVFDSPEGQQWTLREAWLAKREMLRTMLAERFHLVVHMDTKQADGFELRVSAKGPSLVLAPPLLAGDTGKESPYFQRCNAQGCQLMAKRISIKITAAILGGQLRGHVVDKTGLPETNLYAFALKWRNLFRNDDGGSDEPVLTDAVKELGLELKPTKVMEDVVVVEKVERPSEN